MEIISNLKIINRIFTRKDRIKFFLLFVMMLSGSMLEAIGVGLIPVYISFLMNPGSLNENQWLSSLLPQLPTTIDLNLLIISSGALAVFTLMKNIFLGSVFYSQARLVNSLRVVLSSRMFNVYQAASYEWHLNTNSAALLRNIRDDTTQVLNNFIMALLDLVMALLMSGMVIAVLLLTVSGKALFGMVVMGVGLFTVVTIFRRQIRESGATQRAEGAASVKAIQQAFGALVDARISGSESYLSRKFRESMFRLSLAFRRQTSIQKITPYAIETCAIFGLLVVILMLMGNANDFSTIIPTLGLFGVVAIRLKQTSSNIAFNIQRLQASGPYVQGLVDDLDELGQIEESQRLSQGKNPGTFKYLQFEGVGYRYPSNESNVLTDISLTIQAGESVALVGETGCGKSTMMNLMLGLLKPTEGQITVNGQALGDCVNAWWKQIGYIPQSIYLLDDTIRANVAFGIEPAQIDDDKVRQSLQMASLAEYVENQPLGLNTMVGERGVNLSGGQRQRLGIARALYHNPHIIFMDEATSALDNKTEADVMEAVNLMKVNRTLIIIAHRLSTIKSCDRIYYIEKGLVGISGDYNRLLSRSKNFRKLTSNQVGD